MRPDLHQRRETTVLLRRMKVGSAMESEMMKFLWFGAVFGAVIVAVRQVNYMWQDPRKETDAEKRRREKREKKEASKPK